MIYVRFRYLYCELLSMITAIELLDKRSLTRVFDANVPDNLIPNEAIAMINAARLQNRRDELFLKLLWMTDVRVSEATALTTNDIREGSLRVNAKPQATIPCPQDAPKDLNLSGMHLV